MILTLIITAIVIYLLWKLITSIKRPSDRYTSQDDRNIYEWYLKALKQYANFKGRASRKEFWMFILFQSAFVALAYIINYRIFDLGDSPVWQFYTLYGISWLLLIYIFGTIIPTAAITVRRLHDAGRSGIWFYFPFALRVLFFVAGIFIDIQQWLLIGVSVFDGLVVIILFVFLLQKSVENEHKQISKE